MRTGQRPATIRPSEAAPEPPTPDPRTRSDHDEEELAIFRRLSEVSLQATEEELRQMISPR